MKTDIWMPVYIGDYLGDTQHLSAEKHGIYFLLMMHYWKQGPLANDLDELSCVARTTEDKVLKILQEFFTLENGFWNQGRMDKEKAKAKGRSKAAREKAKKRWDNEASSQNDAGADATADTKVDATVSSQHGKSMPGGCSSSSSSSSSSKTPSKHKYGEFKNVLLTEDEHSRLISDWGEVEARRWIEELSEGMARKEYKYKSHNLAIRKWRQNSVEKQPGKMDQYNLTGQRREGF